MAWAWAWAPPHTSDQTNARIADTIHTGAREAVAVTRCRDFAAARSADPTLTMEAHVAASTDRGIRFHTDRKAEVVKLLPDFRVADWENQGIGVRFEEFEPQVFRVKACATHLKGIFYSTPPLNLARRCWCFTSWRHWIGLRLTAPWRPCHKGGGHKGGGSHVRGLTRQDASGLPWVKW